MPPPLVPIETMAYLFCRPDMLLSQDWLCNEVLRPSPEAPWVIFYWFIPPYGLKFEAVDLPIWNGEWELVLTKSFFTLLFEWWICLLLLRLSILFYPWPLNWSLIVWLADLLGASLPRDIWLDWFDCTFSSLRLFINFLYWRKNQIIKRYYNIGINK